MATLRIPYPPSPTNVPEDLTEYSDSYRSKEKMLLVGLVLFMLFYVAIIGFFALIGVLVLFLFDGFLIVRLGVSAICLVMVLFLVKGFFRRSDPDRKTGNLRVYPDEQPILFAFIHKICDEVKAPRPRAVYVSYEVNAACMPRISFMSLFRQPEKDLMLGLGLVNYCTLSELKAVIAHEFGHFAQSSTSSSYSYVVRRTVIGIIEGEDWFDRMLHAMRQSGDLGKLIAAPAWAFTWVMRKVLLMFLKIILLQEFAVSREQEYHADLVAASVAGSNAVAHCLLKVKFAALCMNVAADDLHKAMDHKLYTDDLFLHHERSAAVVRRKLKDPAFGIPPDLKTPQDGRKVRVLEKYREWDERQEEEGAVDADEELMWSTHPPAHDREDNVKENFIAAVADNRSAWVLFTDAKDLRTRSTYKFYRMEMNRKRNIDLVASEKVQQFIDDERAETTYDPKYENIYDDRVLDPGNIGELNQLIDESPWTDDRLEQAYARLYQDAKQKIRTWLDLNNEVFALEANLDGRGGRKGRRMVEKAAAERDEAWEWVQSFDRRVYLVHVQMAARVNEKWRSELVERYRFEAVVKSFYQESREHHNRAHAFGKLLFSTQDPHPELIVISMSVFRQAWRVLKNIIADAKDVNLPAMKNFTEGDNLADFILDEKLISELPLSGVHSKWVEKLLKQLDKVQNRCTRLHFKSVGGILSLQEKIHDAWTTTREPLEAEVIEEIPTQEAKPAAAVETKTSKALPKPTKGPATSKAGSSAQQAALAPKKPIDTGWEVVEDEPVSKPRKRPPV